MTTDATTRVKDPVCGMTIDPRSAAGQSDYAGTTYFFCSDSMDKKSKCRALISPVSHETTDRSASLIETRACGRTGLAAHRQSGISAMSWLGIVRSVRCVPSR
jgi:YHS domain-containing protein